MPVPQAELDAQHVLILAQQLVLSAAIVAEDEEDILAARQELGRLVAGLVPILFEGSGFHPPTPAGRDYELIYQVAYGLAPAF